MISGEEVLSGLSGMEFYPFNENKTLPKGGPRGSDSVRLGKYIFMIEVFYLSHNVLIHVSQSVSSHVHLVMILIF